MALIIVDGYNLTGVLYGDMEAERERLVSALSEYQRRKGHEITVVFDGWKDGGGRESVKTAGGVRVVYSALGEKADSVIKRTVTADRQWIVVTSDREIQKHAWARGSVAVGSEEFIRILERGGTGEGHYDEEDEDEEEYDHRPRKGNPRKTSRRRKALERALRKL
jgi:predicted RNA-binding protein with PIN domain